MRQPPVTLTQFSWPNPRVTENDVSLEDRVALPGFVPIKSVKKRHQQDSTSTRKQQQTSININKKHHEHHVFWLFQLNMNRKPSPPAPTLEPWSLGGSQVPLLQHSSTRPGPRSRGPTAPTYLSLGA